MEIVIQSHKDILYINEYLIFIDREREYISGNNNDNKQYGFLLKNNFV